ncbi:hypothetical protein E3N88_17738 [Mikania micrantha]|uniref:Uncharacterized protein n=1 Tax=Mikania micrantha TaxID=192012 RepID=A0A5N6NSP4_9ASTR|nr:hypothetical protein E3N88_17738 [Mikania micrantha]
MIEKRARLGQNNKNKLIGPYGWARRYARPGAPKAGVARAMEMERLTWLLPRVTTGSHWSTFEKLGVKNLELRKLEEAIVGAYHHHQLLLAAGIPSSTISRSLTTCSRLQLVDLKLSEISCFVHKVLKYHHACTIHEYWNDLEYMDMFIDDVRRITHG